MTARFVVAVTSGLIVLALTAVGCGSPESPQAVTVTPVNGMPGGAEEIKTAPPAGNTDCDREASLRPGPQPSPGAMPPGSTMAAILERGRLIVGVDQATNLFGSRNPATGRLEGFDIDLARELARDIFGDPDRVDLRVVTAAQRETALQEGQVDLVVRTYSITCDRKNKVAFSTPYYVAKQRILATKGSGIRSAADLSGKRVCAVKGTTSLAALFALDPRPTLYGVSQWTDCLVMIQQGQVDAISTDDVVLAGLKDQDQKNLELVGPSIGDEPYGVGVKLGNDDLVRFVNGALAQMREDGTWERLYQANLQEVAPSPGPPQARYQD
ncbi:glutamate ABC transporter substrate-binding protein [Mycolicibacterium hodleri]|uniref:Glutamate ABC transporter substrate-binding protein n=1 Tax=Mycolicibacterium hodleri TaxID=49897 RepID=A0A502E5W4_9MYCO|nr:glutamate ABC transporter substrate-binding protein [Mycolicibacterium hodleri]TPG32744.1 glutamate ABC transporter substrate-binding protein [Mycolicibacterium hodleri]